MFADASKNMAGRYLSAVLIIIATFSSAGCRQDPATEPKYYARELEQIRREELRAAAAKEEKFLKDGYPWRDKTAQPSMQCLPCRITVTEKEMAAEIKYLHETVHGKKKSRLRFRD